MEKEMATHSSILAWRIPGTGEPGGLPFMGLHRVGHNWSDLAAAAARLNVVLDATIGWHFRTNTSIRKCESRSVVSDSLWPHRLYSPWNSPGQNTGVGSISFLQGIFPIQGLKPGLWHCRQIYQLSHKGSPGMLEWVAYPFSSGSFRPRYKIGVSCIAGRFFTSWAATKALLGWCDISKTE